MKKLFAQDPKKYYKNNDGKWVDLRTEEEKLSDERAITKQHRADLLATIIKWVLGLVFAVAIMSAILD